MTLAVRTRKFWCAAFFYRRAGNRDRSIAVKVLEQLVPVATGTVQRRAATLLREINHGTDQYPPRAG